MSRTAALSSSFSSFPVSSSSFSFSISPSRTVNNVSETLHVPLTTIFTPPFRCTQIPYTLSTVQSGVSTFWRNAYGPGEGEDAGCYPSSFRFEHRSTMNADYSPGVCPHGYTAASVAENTRRGAWTSWCCPLGMSYGPDFGCYTTISTATEVKLDSVRTTSIDEPFVAADWYVKVAWASSELNQFTPRSAPLAPQFTLNRPSAPNTTGLPDGPSSALTVGIPVGLVTTAVVAVACYALWRRKRRRTRDESLVGDLHDERKEWSSGTDEEPLRCDSARQQTSSDDTPMTNNTDSSPLRNERERLHCVTSARQDSWRDSLRFDETQPITEPR